ncbi:MAG: HAD-IIB family hydrolase [Agriterribacter sp.]
MLLATDLDGTFLGGEAIKRRELYNIIHNHSDIKLVFVSGRGLHSILPVFTGDPAPPQPECIICDVGATIVDGYTHEAIDPVQTIIEKKWQGQQIIYEQLKHIKGLIPQDVPQERRCSFFFNDETDTATLRKTAMQLNCDMILSAGRFADILPGGVNKGTTLQAYINLINYPVEDVLVAGDTFNDLSLFTSGYKGVVVGNAEPGLLSAIKGAQHIYHAVEHGAGGILEAMDYFSFFKK